MYNFYYQSKGSIIVLCDSEIFVLDKTFKLIQRVDDCVFSIYMNIAIKSLRFLNLVIML